MMRRPVNGILLLDKPKTFTSNGALQRAKRLFSAKKAGHTGSLDPEATGMLPICFGEATKFSQHLLDSSKSYTVTARLGQQTNTGDCEGEIIATKPVPELSQAQLNAVLQSFFGETEQIPPMFSAIKHQGRPLYELARKGIEIERKSRRITIYRIEFEAYANHELRFNVHCTKGTYVRTLVEDIGNALGCGAHVIELRRTSVDPYANASMYSLEELEGVFNESGHGGLIKLLLPVETALQSFPSVKLSTAATFYLRMGQAVRAPFQLDAPFVRLLADDERFLGIGEVLADGRVKPHRLVSQNELPATG